MNKSIEGRIVLASRSSARSEMLRQVGLEIIVAVSDLDESLIKGNATKKNIDFRSIAAQLAKAKADVVTKRFPGDLIIGADQVLACGGALIDKAGNRQEACKILETLSGQSHELHTAVCVMRDSTVLWCYMDSAECQFCISNLNKPIVPIN